MPLAVIMISPTKIYFEILLLQNRVTENMWMCDPVLLYLYVNGINLEYYLNVDYAARGY